MSDILSETPRLSLPVMAAAQAQKHVTHNEALAALDRKVHTLLQGLQVETPPALPTEGEAYHLGVAPSGAWSGRTGWLATYLDGGWTFDLPFEGMTVFSAADGQLATYYGGAWILLADTVGITHTQRLSSTPHGAETLHRILEEEVTVSGESSVTTIVIPSRSVVYSVSTRTTAAITGASAYDCGIEGETKKFGGSLGITAGSTNVGVIGPTAFYAPTPVWLTAVGGSFTGGKVRVAIHYFMPSAPTL